MTWIYWAMGSAFFAAATAILAKIGVENIPANLATAIRTTVALVFCWILAAITTTPGSIGNVSPRNWLFLCLSGLATGLSWVCYFNAIKLGPVSKVAPIDKLSVVLAIIFAAIFLGERLTGREGIGASLIIAGVIALAWK